MKKRFTLMILLLIAALTLSACAKQEEPAAAFTPKLDTDKAVNLEIAGFFGNFEALDQVINHFNAYYPNVTTTYEQIGSSKMVEYLKNNPYIDVFMTDDINLRYPNMAETYVLDQCADLGAAGITISNSDVAAFSTFDGKLARVPMSYAVRGMVVNKTLLKKEGLSVPTNYEEFLAVLEALKQKGYTPIQGPENVVYSALSYSMVMATLGSDSELMAALNNGDEAAVQKLTEMLSRVQTFLDRGYIDREVNATYPENNYDGAILTFMEGDVPFWTCTSEHYSGMRKRESKSEAFKANPFEYQFIFPPMGDTGAYEYMEPWYGFSVNQSSDALDYALEFLRFLSTDSELNTLASVKGVPSIVDDPEDTRYTDLNAHQNVQLAYTNSGAILNHVTEYFLAEMKNFGEVGAQAVAAQYVERCAEVTAQ